MYSMVLLVCLVAMILRCLAEILDEQPGRAQHLLPL